MSTQMTATTQHLMSLISAAERRADHFTAADLAATAAAQFPADAEIQHRYLLALARSGARQVAANRLAKLIAEQPTCNTPEISSLSARLAKDKAFRLQGQERRAAAVHAAKAYEQIYREHGGYYPAMNAATLWQLAGFEHSGQDLAMQARALATEDVARDASDYWALATLGEAELLLGNVTESKKWLTRATNCCGGDLSRLASTRLQLAVLCRSLGNFSVLDALVVPTVFSFTFPQGNAFFQIPSADTSAKIQDRLAAVVEGLVYCPVWGPVQIVAAEAAIEISNSTEIVLPIERNELAQEIESNCGREWARRFSLLLERAQGLVYLTEGTFFSDPELVIRCQRLARGLANLRASFLSTAAEVVEISSVDQECIVPFLAEGDARRRQQKAIVFGDFKGFSKLKEDQTLRFQEHVMDGIGRVLAEFEHSIEFSETSGDGITLVMSDVAHAARCLLAMQGFSSCFDMVAHGLPEYLSLRLAGHAGPVFRRFDGVEKRQKFFGNEIVRAARIEPITPPGGVYVSAQFAAQLFLESPEEFTPEYVGEVPCAKNFGSFRMYSLERRLATFR